jgi:hypothetical protein
VDIKTEANVKLKTNTLLPAHLQKGRFAPRPRRSSSASTSPRTTPHASEYGTPGERDIKRARRDFVNGEVGQRLKETAGTQDLEKEAR